MWAKLTALHAIVLAQLVIIFTGLHLYDFGYKKYNLSRLVYKSDQSTVGLLSSTASLSTTSSLNTSTTASREPLILLFNQWSTYPHWGFEWERIGKTSELLHLPNCPHKCRYTIDRERYERTADMVLVNTFYLKRVKHKPNFSRKSILKNQKKTGQIWVGVTAESPANEKNFGRKGLDDVFHWIATYRRDSDIFWPYATYVKRNVPLKVNENPEKKRSKRKLVAWLVSHCHSESKREILVHTLQRYIPVDIYGKCSSRKFPKGMDIRTYIKKNYKFYLAFENSLCVNYVTEKLFYILNETEGIVPITYSWINDTTLAPPNSYIDASDFKSVKHLADYLQYLDKNDEKYNRYLEWKKHYEIVFRASTMKMCLACRALLKYKEGLENGSQRLKRIPSMLKRHKSLGHGANNSFLKISGNYIKMKHACFDPFTNKASKDWLLGANG